MAEELHGLDRERAPVLTQSIPGALDGLTVFRVLVVVVLVAICVAVTWRDVHARGGDGFAPKEREEGDPHG